MVGSLARNTSRELPIPQAVVRPFEAAWAVRPPARLHAARPPDARPPVTRLCENPFFRPSAQQNLLTAPPSAPRSAPSHFPWPFPSPRCSHARRNSSFRHLSLCIMPLLECALFVCSPLARSTAQGCGANGGAAAANDQDRQPALQLARNSFCRRAVSIRGWGWGSRENGPLDQEVGRVPGSGGVLAGLINGRADGWASVRTGG